MTDATPSDWIALAERAEKAAGTDRAGEIDFASDRRVRSVRETVDALNEARDIFSFNPDSGVLTWKKSGKAYMNGSEAGSKNSNGYRQVRFRGRSSQVHRIGWAIYHGRWPFGLLDHINGDKSDNRISNLREATGSLNAFNKDILTSCLGRGVSVKRNRFTARITRNGQDIHLGTYDTKDEAVAAYKGATIALFGYRACRAMAEKAKENSDGR